MKIIIIDDDDDSRVLLSNYFQSKGHDVVSAENGAQALRLVTIDTDLLITDILMPEVDGFELLRRIKSSANLSQLPVVFYTATYTDDRDMYFALSLGATAFFIKPMDPQQLYENVMRSLDTPALVQKSYTDKEFSQEHKTVINEKLTKKMHELREERENLEFLARKLDAINNAIPVVIMELDPMLRINYANAVCENWFATAISALVGTDILGLFEQSGRKQVADILHRSLHGESIFEEIDLISKSKGMMRVQLHTTPLFHSMETVSGLIVMLTDITPQHELQKQNEIVQQRLQHSQKLEIVGELAGGIAHDFNNILTVIRGYSELGLLLCKNKDEIELRKYFSEIYGAGNKGKDIVKQLLAFCRSDDSDGNAELVNLESAIRELVNMLFPILPADMQVELELQAQDAFAVINSTQLDQVLMNLAVNANDAMQGRGVVKISLCQQVVQQRICSSCYKEFQGSYYVIQVKDNGCGIEADKLNRLFEPFYTTKKRGEGTGLGLAMVHGITHQAGGHMLVESSATGSTFSVLLPVASGDQLESLEESVAELTQLPSADPDNPDIG